MTRAIFNTLADVPTPAYLVDLDVFRRNHQAFKAAFEAVYPNVQIGYSYKTNYARPLISLNKELGGYAEVVSGFEMDMALGIEHSAEEIYFNGPLKTDEELKRIVTSGCQLNADSYEEVERVIRMAEMQECQFGIGLRLAFESDPVLGLSRFGIEHPGVDYDAAINLIRASRYVNLTGIHAHYADRSSAVVAQTAKRVVDVLKALDDRDLRTLQYFSIGGGFCGPMEDVFARQFAENPPSYEEYASRCADDFAEVIALYDHCNLPRLLLEPGTAIVADSVEYLCRVHAKKQRGGGRFIAVTDGSNFARGGISKGVEPAWSRVSTDPLHPYSLDSDAYSEQQQISETITQVVGYTCVEGDVLIAQTTEPISVGDLLTFRYSGAYSLVMRPPFIRMDEIVVVRSELDGLRLARDVIDTGFSFDSYEF